MLEPGFLDLLEKRLGGGLWQAAAVGAARLWWQKWRWYERNSLPWNRVRDPPRVHGRRRVRPLAAARATCWRRFVTGRLEVGEGMLLEPQRVAHGPGRGPHPDRRGQLPEHRRDGGRASSWSRSASTACSPTDASSPTATTASTTPTSPCPGRASRTKGPTRIGDNVWCGANVVVGQRRDDRRALRDRGQQRGHAGRPAVLDRGGRAGAGDAGDGVRGGRGTVGGRPPVRELAADDQVERPVAGGTRRSGPRCEPPRRSRSWSARRGDLGASAERRGAGVADGGEVGAAANVRGEDHLVAAGGGARHGAHAAAASELPPPVTTAKRAAPKGSRLTAPCRGCTP